jgi:hypothetical protein
MAPTLPFTLTSSVILRDMGVFFVVLTAVVALFAVGRVSERPNCCKDQFNSLVAHNFIQLCLELAFEWISTFYIPFDFGLTSLHVYAGWICRVFDALPLLPILSRVSLSFLSRTFDAAKSQS